MKIVALTRAETKRIAQCAALLREAFPDLPARRTVMDSLRKGNISLVAMKGDAVAGWIAAMPQYDGCVWEIHPLVVASEHRRSGIGMALIKRLESEVRARGAITLWAGSDDESNQTTLAGADLYRDLPGAIANIRNLREHPYEFYLKAGFKIVGVMPDANGFGKPDIFLAKRVKKPAAGNAAG